MNAEYTARTRLLIGDAAMEKLSQSFVAVVGLGGVGGTCAEALARSGVGRLLLVDADTVSESNLNRQLVSEKRTLGQRKTQAMAARICAVSDAETAIADAFVTNDNVSSVLPVGLDFIVDAIDSVEGKAALASFAFSNNVPVIGCLGTGNRLDPMQLTVTSVYETEGDPLARKLRNLLRKKNIANYPVVFSREAPQAKKGQTVVGSFMPVTSAAGLLLASYVIQNLQKGA